MKTKGWFSPQETKMIIINGIYTLAQTMTAVFVNVYLYSYTKSLITMTAYTMVRFAFFPIAFYLGAQIGRKWRLSISLTSGLLFIIGGLLILLSVRQEIAQFPSLIYLIGLIFGIGEGMYWLSINSLNQIVTSKHSRNNYISALGVFNSISNIAAPLIAATIVLLAKSDIQGYIIIFEVVIVLYVFISFLATQIFVPIKKERFTVFDKVIHVIDRQWHYIIQSHVLYGIRDALVLSLMGLLIYKATGGSGSFYGQLMAVFSVISILSYLIANQMIRRYNLLRLFRYGAFFVSLSTIVFALIPNLWGALFYGVVASMFAPLYVNPFQMITMDTISDYMEKDNILGYVIAKEIALTTGRLVGLMVVIILSVILSESLFLPFAIILCSLFPLILVLYATYYHRRQYALQGEKEIGHV